MRIPIIDGFRGFFLIFMTITHLNALLHTKIGKLNFGALGWFDNAHGFVMLSGLVVGLVYGGLLLRQGFAVTQRAIWYRTQTIYVWHASLVILFLCTALLLAEFGAENNVLTSYRLDPLSIGLSSLLLVGGTMHMGILPMYIWFMIATPFVLLALHRGQWRLVAGISLGLWLFAQTALPNFIGLRADQTLLNTGHAAKIGLYFNVFGWQTLFIAGVSAGYLMAARRLDLRFLATRFGSLLFGLSIVMFLSLFALDRALHDQLVSPAIRGVIERCSSRPSLSIIHVLAVISDTYIVVWLLLVGRNVQNPTIRWAGTALNNVFTSAPLTYLGKHSLQVFAAHLVLVYAVYCFYDVTPTSSLIANTIIILSPCVLFLAAYLHNLWQLHEVGIPKSARG
jgi:hypothetical protein